MSKNTFPLANLGELSKPLTKLVEAVSACVGTLYEPTRIRRKAKAQKDAMIIVAKGEIAKEQLAQRAAHRLAVQELRHQENIEAIIRLAAEHMPEDVSDDPVDPDWVSRFFSECQDVSQDDLQKLWGRLLAREVASPGACSRATLRVLQEMGPQDAQIFEKFASLATFFQDAACIFLVLTNPAAKVRPRRSSLGGVDWEAYDCGFGELIHLDSMGLLHAKKGIHCTLKDADEFWQCGTRYLVSFSGKEPQVPIIPLTGPGEQLAAVCPTQANDLYSQDMIGTFRHRYGIALACVVEQSNNDLSPCASPRPSHE